MILLMVSHDVDLSARMYIGVQSIDFYFVCFLCMTVIASLLQIAIRDA